MTTKITRRALLGAAGAGVVTLGSAEAAALAASSEASGSREPHYAMVFDQNKCVGCGDCKAACNEANHLPPGISRLLMERQSKSHRVIGKEPCPICGKLEECDCERKYVRVSCQQCQDAPCVTVCPTGAWAIEFWVGVVCVGFCGPLVLGLIGGGLMSFYLSALCSVAGMMCLRLFILYAGQLHGL